MVEVPLGPAGAGGREMEKNTGWALGSSALEFQPGTLPTCLCISHRRGNVFPAGVSSPCTVCVSMSTGHSWVSQGPRVGAVPSTAWDTKATQNAGPDSGQWAQAGLFLGSGARLDSAWP